MVEGPKVTIKAARLSKLKGQVCRGAGRVSPKDAFEVFNGSHLEDVKAVGKELFLLFTCNTHAIRLHFGMSGSERLLSAESAGGAAECNLIPAHSRKLLTAVLLFEKHSLYLFDTSVTVKTTAYVCRTLQRLHLDVMCEAFSVEAVAELVRRDTRAIHEVLMDQIVLPGVGNVIKCEGLFMSSINPEQLACSLSEPKLRSLICHLKQFSWEWYRCTLKHTQPSKLVYGRKACSSCQRSVTLVRSGRQQRISYFCSHCQPLITGDLVAAEVDATRPTDLCKRACGFCGFLNETQAMSCEICGQKSSDVVQAASLSNQPTTTIDSTALICNVLEVVHPLESTVDEAYLQQPICQCQLPAELHRVRKAGKTMSRLFWSCSRGSHSGAGLKRKRCDFFHWADNLFPRCEHALPCVLRRVLKPGQSNGRYFFSCGLSDRTLQCKCFSWADGDTDSKAARSDEQRINPDKQWRSTTNISIPL